MNTQYIPKGSMCGGCAKAKEDCSALPFSDMRVIETEKNISVVRCTHYEAVEQRCDKTVDMFDLQAQPENFKKVFRGNGSAFSAAYEAEQWLSDNGYSVGPSCVMSPRAVFKGDCWVAKWRNLTPKERSLADGTLDSGRDQPAILILKVAPK